MTRDSEIAAAVGEAFPGRRVRALSRQPYTYATSARLELLQVEFTDGGAAELILKHLAWERLLHVARSVRPRFLHDPAREIGVYRHLLAPVGLGPRCLATGDGPDPWVLLEKVAGRELWQIGDVATWEVVARWLADFHLRYAGQTDQARRLCPSLLAIDHRWRLTWVERARQVLSASSDPRAVELLRFLRDYGNTVAVMASSMPRTLVHGEFVPSNVLVDPAGDVRPVDWEMAAIGPPALDLAALVVGWDAPVRHRLLAAYRAGLAAGGGSVPSAEAIRADVDRSRLQLALQWIGWSDSWRPPPEHARDWIAEALGLAHTFTPVK